MRFYNNMIESIEKIYSYFYDNPNDATFISYSCDDFFYIDDEDGFDKSGFIRFYDVRLEDDTPEWLKDITICRVVYDEEDKEDVWCLDLRTFDMPDSLWDCGVRADYYSIKAVFDAVSDFCGESNQLDKEALLIFMKDIFNVNIHIIDKGDVSEEK